MATNKNDATHFYELKLENTVSTVEVLNQISGRQRRLEFTWRDQQHSPLSKGDFVVS